MPDHQRVEWRGPSTLRDGTDVGRDLTGGWYDAGDGVVWTANDAFGATLLAWALVNYRAEFVSTGQYARGLDALRLGTDYLIKCVDATSPTGFRIYVGKGATSSTLPDNPVLPTDHAAHFPHELLDTPNVANGLAASERPSYWVDAATGGADIAGHVAAALACASIAFRQGREEQYADTLLGYARAVYSFGESHPNASTTTRRITNGAVVDLPSYNIRSASWTKPMILAAAWLQRAEISAATPGYSSGYIDKAEILYNSSEHAVHRLKHWRSFETGEADMGAYPMLAADSGRAVFVAEANSYANFWLNSRFNTSGLSTDPILTPAGIIARIQGAGFNIHKLLDQAPPLLEWADAQRNTDTNQKNNLVGLFTGTYTNAAGVVHGVRQIDYILGDNPLHMSYLQGYAKPGHTWVSNLHYRSGTFAYGGFGTPAADQPLANTFTVYGLLAPGPDHLDYYPQQDLPLSAGNYGHREPVIYTGGHLSVLARRIRQLGTAAGQPLSVFPEWIERGATYQTEDFYLAAYRRTDAGPANGIRLVAHLANRASLPAREVPDIGFRLYFTLDGTTDPSRVTMNGFWPTVWGQETCTWSGPLHAGGSLYYFEVRYTNCSIGPGDYNNWRRNIEFSIVQSAGKWNSDNDPAFAGLPSGVGFSGTPVLAAGVPIYDFGTAPPSILGGYAPGPGVVRWRRQHIANVTEKAPLATLIAERVGGSSGAVSVAYSTADIDAKAGLDYETTSGAFHWSDGETGEKSVHVPLHDDPFFENRPSFLVTLASPTGGASIEGGQGARVFIEDDDFDGATRPDLVPFSIQIDSPAASSIQSRSFTVSGSAYGPDGIESISYRVGSGPWQAASGTTSWSFQAGPFESGPLTVEVRATSSSADAAVTSKTLSLTIDASGPSFASIVASATDQAASISWVTSASADSRVIYGLSPEGLTLDSGVLTGLRANHTISLTGLLPSTTYYCRLVSTDGLGNVNQSPLLMFITGAPPIFEGTVAGWDFSGNNGRASAPASLAVTGLSASATTLGPGLGVTTTSNGLTGNQQTSSTLQGALSGNDYLTFTLAPSDGWMLNVTALKFRPISTSGFRTFTVFSSLDGFAIGKELGSFTHSGSSGAPLYAVPLTGFRGFQTPVEFRVYIHGQTSANRSVGLGNGADLDLIVEGKLFDPPPPASTLNTWICSPLGAVPVERRQPLDDPDGDGASNMLEYALGGDPMSASDPAKTTGLRSPDGDRFTLTYRRLRPELYYSVEASAALDPSFWSTNGVDQGYAAVGEQATASVPCGHNQDLRFLRLKVTTQP